MVWLRLPSTSGPPSIIMFVSLSFLLFFSDLFLQYCTKKTVTNMNFPPGFFSPGGTLSRAALFPLWRLLFSPLFHILFLSFPRRAPFTSANQSAVLRNTPPPPAMHTSDLTLVRVRRSSPNVCWEKGGGCFLPANFKVGDGVEILFRR